MVTWRSTVLLFCLAAGLAQAQFTNLTAPGDGIGLFFSSTRPLKGSGGVQQDRLFSVGSGPVGLVAEGRTPVIPDPPPFAGESAWFVSDYYRYIRREASLDRLVVATVMDRLCLGGYGCLNVEPCQTRITGVPGKGTQLFTGQGWLSANGRWLVTSACGFYSQSVVTDLQTGQQTPGAGIRSTGGGRIVSDNGTAVLVSGGGAWLVHDGIQTPLPTSMVSSVSSASIDATGDKIVYSGPDLATNQPSVRVFHLRTNTDVPLVPGIGTSYAPIVNSDGSLILFLSNGSNTDSGPAQLYSYSTTPFGTSIRKLTDDADGVSAFAAADVGAIAWYVSGSGRVVKMDVSSGTAEEKIPSTPQVTFHIINFAAGSLLTAEGTALPTANVKVKFGDLEAPVITASTTKIVAQIPWETPSSPRGTTVIAEIALQDPQTPFDTTFRQNTSVYSTLPAILPPGYHGDWSGPISELKPAQPGEIVTFYALGLGPVQPAVATGTAGPADPPARTINSYTCNATVLYSGLAPGLVGYYQFSVQLPSTASSGDFSLKCSGPGMAQDQTVVVFPVKAT